MAQPHDPAISAYAEALATQLRVFGGHRTLWIDDGTGEIVHAEPDDLLETLGLRYLGTFMQPGRDEITTLLAGQFHSMPTPEPAATLEPVSARPFVSQPALA